MTTVEVHKSKKLCRPCPFCSSLHTKAWDMQKGWRVVCEGCDATTAAFGSEDEALAAWNRRSADSYLVDWQKEERATKVWRCSRCEKRYAGTPLKPPPR
jgi:ribosomal protein L37AE/L43A